MSTINHDFRIVGLSTRRPFRFCTRHTGADMMKTVRPGDYDINRDQFEGAISVFVPVHETPPHIHEFYEIVLVHQGTSVHHDETGERMLGRGDVVAIFPGAWHSYIDERDFVYTNLYLLPDWLLDDLRVLWSEKGFIRILLADALFGRQTSGGVRHFSLSEEEVLACEAELRQMEREAVRSDPSLTLYNACFLKILWNMNQGYGRENRVDGEVLLPEVWTAASLIEQSAREGGMPDMDHLAKVAECSRTHLGKVFLSGTGMSISDYFRKRRLHLAKRALLDPHLSITDIAHQFGFTDASHFGRLFRQSYGITPSEFRQSNQMCPVPPLTQ